MFTPELPLRRAPLKNMRYAFAYGADAVSMPDSHVTACVSVTTNLTTENLAKGIQEAHELGKKFYVVVNIAPHNAKLKTFIRDLKASDYHGSGRADYVRSRSDHDGARAFPQMDIHFIRSGQRRELATVKFWHQMGRPA